MSVDQMSRIRLGRPRLSMSLVGPASGWNVLSFCVLLIHVTELPFQPCVGCPYQLHRYSRPPLSGHKLLFRDRLYLVSMVISQLAPVLSVHLPMAAIDIILFSQPQLNRVEAHGTDEIDPFPQIAVHARLSITAQPCADRPRDAW